MAELLLFHHAQGLTEGVLGFAERLREAGHTVHTPDLYDGNTFADLEEGIGYAQRVGFGTLLTRGVAQADGLGNDLVYAGMSLGVMPAQQLAQQRPGARGALFLHACLPTAEFGSWPDGLPAQVHGMDADPWFADEDLPSAQALVEGADQAELFLYPGKEHLFTDSSLMSYVPEAATLLTQRVLEFLAGR